MNSSPLQSSLLPTRLPWLLWPFALLLGVLVAVGSLSYSPSGRINVLWIWLLWAGLPLLGSLVSLWAIFFGGHRPWLFQWRSRQVHWHPSARQRLEMLALLQRLWCVVGLGILAGYWMLLLFTDLAFGWSSTLIDDGRVILSLAHTIAAPWQGVWPAAVPDADLISGTRYLRIAPTMDSTNAGGWWPFLMASLLCYNLLPRLLLSGVIAVRLHGLRGHELNVRAPLIVATATPTVVVNEDAADHWRDAVIISWEIRTRDTQAAQLGVADWAQDEATLKTLLDNKPERLLWRVNASRSPVAELSDLIRMARAAGVHDQALLAVSDATTDPARHIASWRAFANQQQLIWLKETP